MCNPGAAITHKLRLASVDMHTVRGNRLRAENAKAVQPVNRPQPVLIEVVILVCLVFGNVNVKATVPGRLAGCKCSSGE